MKTCHKCGEEKPLDGFYKTGRDGRRDTTCKKCRKARVRQNREENIGYYRQYDRQRAMLPHRVTARERYQKTPEGKEAIKRGTSKYRQRNPIKLQAHNRVSKALHDGRLKRKSSCEGCGTSKGRIHAHHDDYLRQLDVRWLCPPCHKAWHDEHGEAANADHPPLPQFHLKPGRHSAA
ncbi:MULTISPECIES: hypothetical protein [Halomonadaceae]|uniref:hypothetical protein n=1 Tax=Halomonadaceae TaxID=28256 RepID=UPI001ABEF4E8|nr:MULTISPECIES: hypothetical protein [Halomonas]